MKIRHHSALLLVTTAIVSTATLAQLVGEPTFELSWNTIIEGGGTSTGGGYSLTGTIGQLDVGSPIAGGGIILTSGFWNDGDSSASHCPADITPAGSPDGVVNVDDLLAVINAWGLCR